MVLQMTAEPRSATASPDLELVDRLRAGDPVAFRSVVEQWSPAMLHAARSYVSTRASAEEVVQETWLAVIRGLDGFQQRSSLRTWVFHILANIGRRRGSQEQRTVPWSHEANDELGPTVDPQRFRGADDAWEGGWRQGCAPRPWGPEAAALSAEIRSVLADALDQLPPQQRSVVAMRDIDGLSAEEVCVALSISSSNQRVLLHRARGRLRQLLEDYYRDDATNVSARDRREARR